MLLTSIIWFILGSLVTVIIMYRLRPGITVKEIDPIVVLRAKEKANMSGRVQIVTSKGDHYNVRDAVKGWNQIGGNEQPVCTVYPDKKWLIPDSPLTQR